MITLPYYYYYYYHHRPTAAVHCGHPRTVLSRRLQLNPSKTEVIWFGTKASLKKTENIDLTLHVGMDVIGSASSVRDLGVILDCELSMKKHISRVTSVCCYHLRRLKTVRRILGVRQPPVSSRLSSSVNSTIAILYLLGCRSQASCLATGAKCRRQADSRRY